MTKKLINFKMQPKEHMTDFTNDTYQEEPHLGLTFNPINPDVYNNLFTLRGAMESSNFWHTVDFNSSLFVYQIARLYIFWSFFQTVFQFQVSSFI